MSVRLQFPRAGSFFFTRQVVVSGNPLDLTGATFAAYLKYSPDDADADAITAITVTVLVAAAGTVTLYIPAGVATASLPLGVEYYWSLQVTKASIIYMPENCQGPVVLTPIDGVLAGLLSTDLVTETLTPEDDIAIYSAAGSAVVNRPDITGLTGGTLVKLDSIVTAGSATYPVNTIVILSYGGVSQLWKLIAGTTAEDVGATPAIVRPDDYNASTNAVIWQQIG